VLSSTPPRRIRALRLVPLTPVAVGTPVAVSATYTDPGTNDTHTLVIDWAANAGGLPSAGTAANGMAQGTHTYTQPGVYTVKLTLSDDDGGTYEGFYEEYIVVYDPSAGFVTGGGWIDSPPGACRFGGCTDETTGKAHFGFVSRYHKGAKKPEGNTSFDFKAGNLSFKSTAYEWLVIAGARAQYKGVGTINGSGQYGFMLTAIDGALPGGRGVDRFRVKIWDLASGAIVYDNQMGAADDAEPSTALGGGSIQIHSK